MSQPPITGWVPRPTGSQPWDSQIPRDNRYYITMFGGGRDAQNSACSWASLGDRSIPRSQTSPSQAWCDGTWWYIADTQRFGCGGKVRITNPENGKSCVAIAADIGPNISVERSAGGPVIDASPLVLRHLFGRNSYGWSDRVVVVAEVVGRGTPVGPYESTGGMTALTAGALIAMAGGALWWLARNAKGR